MMFLELFELLELLELLVLLELLSLPPQAVSIVAKTKVGIVNLFIIGNRLSANYKANIVQ